VQRDAGLRERGFGVFEGMTFTDIEQHWPEQARRWRERDPDFGPEGGERLCDFFARSVAQVERLAQRHCGQTVVLVSHGGLLDSLYRAALGVPLQAPRSWPVANAVVNRLLWTPQGLSLLLWHDARHLEGAPDDQPPPADTP
jgi:probable phosphoglycerate mutase